VNFDIASACIDIPIRFHFTLFTQQFKIQMQRVQYATYNSLEGCSKARSALTNAPSNEKEKKQVGINYSKNNLIILMSAFWRQVCMRY